LNIDDPDMAESFRHQAQTLLPATLRRRARGSAGVLTEREAEIAALIARGLSNRSIAEKLVLSARTVETHVANAMGKLGFSSRAQLAAWATEHNKCDLSLRHYVRQGPSTGGEAQPRYSSDASTDAGHR
jgi:DNA-binding NarL/FixJ family response regulator